MRWWAPVALGLLVIVTGCGGSTTASDTGSQTRVSSTEKMAASGLPCSSYTDVKPVSCLTRAQRRARALREKAQAKAQAKAAKKAEAAAAVARAKALARSIARGKAQAAADAAANAWHVGYNQQDDNVFWQWRNGGSCQDYATNGCWHIAVITRNGCPNYVGVNANEYQGGAIIGQLLANQGYGIPPQTVRLFELDSNASGAATANNVQVDCT